ncbi:MAG: hypothetical protein H8D67_17510 [Deltaproteobacteria bacterium]|nr:hypothetical protein [Deltaproteobacteria bacterium]
MNRGLSRRVAKIIHSENILALSLEDSIAFVKAVGITKSFNQLSKRWQQIILIAEKSVTKAITAANYKLRFEDIELVELAEIDDEEIEESHNELHRYYAEWLEGEHRDEGDWTFGDLLQKHVFVVAELEKRGRKCEYDDELAKGVKKSLIELIGEATESFVWDDGIHEAVKIVFKGGPGSGNIGHAGRAGIHGESDAMSGYGARLRRIDGWTGLSDDKKREWAAAANGVPDSHSAHLYGIAINDALLEKDGASGEYWPLEGAGFIQLHSQNSTGMTIAHEMGHHIETVYLIREYKDTVYRDFTNAIGLGEVYGAIDAIQVAGLRGYSLKSSSEFWADSYSVWARGRQGDRGCKGFQDNYRVLFPDTAKILDDLFG